MRVVGGMRHVLGRGVFLVVLRIVVVQRFRRVQLRVGGGGVSLLPRRLLQRRLLHRRGRLARRAPDEFLDSTAECRFTMHIVPTDHQRLGQ